jgi:RimJ/RimL family protein N-acetyltransferase
MADGPGSQLGPLRPSYPVRTERLLLRPLTAGDADALLVYRGRDDVSRYVPFEPMSRDDILMRQEARLVHNEFFKGEWSTEVDFAMLAEEWYRLARR